MSVFYHSRAPEPMVCSDDWSKEGRRITRPALPGFTIFLFLTVLLSVWASRIGGLKKEE